MRKWTTPIFPLFFCTKAPYEMGKTMVSSYHLVIQHSHGKSLINGRFSGKSSINGPFSMAMLNNQRVILFLQSTDVWSFSCHCFLPVSKMSGRPSFAARHCGVAQRPKCHCSGEEQQLRARAEASALIHWWRDVENGPLMGDLPSYVRLPEGMSVGYGSKMIHIYIYLYLYLSL